MNDVVRAAAGRPRPHLHFTAPQGWLNDPNGLITWRNQHHLFYQHNPYGIEHRAIHWGHAVSEDLLEWRHLPAALAPDPAGPDRDGCFSGDAILHGGVPAVLYSGNRNGGQLPCLAFATEVDQLTTWRKYPGNPVIPQAPPGFGPNGFFRDHCVWQEDDGYYQVIGSGSEDGRGAVLLYRSADLVDWEYLGPLFVAPDDSVGHMWECPDFFRLGDSWVLVVSMMGGLSDRSVAFFVGEYRERHFRPRVQGLVDGGSRLYAPQTFVDRDGRRVLLGWLREHAVEVPGADWCGWMSLPRVLSLDAEGRLCSEPLPGLAGRRGRLRQALVRNGVRTPLLDTDGPFEIELVAGAGDLADWDLLLHFRDPQASPVAVRWDAPKAGIKIDVTGAPRHLRHAGGGSNGAKALRIFIDRGSVEAFAGGTAAAELFHLPDTRLASVELRSRESCDAVRVKVWELQPFTSEV